MTEAAPAPTDDVAVDPDGGSTRPPWLRWLWLLLPWTWFVVRGIHQVLELVAILLPILVVSAAAAALLMAAWRHDALFLGLFGSLLVFYVVAVVLPGRPIDSPVPEASTRFAAINLAQQWFSDNDVGFFVLDREVEVFVGVELRETHDVILRERFDHALTDLSGFPPNPEPADGTPDLQSTYRRNDFPSIGIYSNHEIIRLPDPIADRVEGGLPGFRAQIATDQGDVVVYALHVPRPGRGTGVFEVRLSDQDEILRAISDAISAEELPVVVIGDLNIVDRGPTFGDFTAELTDVMRIDRWAGPTRKRDLRHTVLQLRIDHLLVSTDLCATNAETRNVLFTDHTPIQADIGPCPAA
jgi:hypothetical protein